MNQRRGASSIRILSGLVDEAECSLASRIWSPELRNPRVAQPPSILRVCIRFLSTQQQPVAKKSNPNSLAAA